MRKRTHAWRDLFGHQKASSERGRSLPGFAKDQNPAVFQTLADPFERLGKMRQKRICVFVG